MNRTILLFVIVAFVMMATDHAFGSPGYTAFRMSKNGLRPRSADWNTYTDDRSDYDNFLNYRQKRNFLPLPPPLWVLP